MKRILGALLLLAALAACKDSTGSGPRVTSLTLVPDVVYLGIGDTIRLTATGEDEDGETVAPRASFRSLNPAVARVDEGGLVTAVAVGTTSVIASASGHQDTAAVSVLPAGSFRTFNVNADVGCESPVFHAARLVASTAHAEFFEDVGNPAGGFTNAEYQAIANQFETQIWPVDVANFGAPTDIDGNSRIVVLYTRAVNELTPAGANFVIGGFFYGRDLFPRVNTPDFQACPSSNVAEMFYLLSPDPEGSINGHERSKDYVRETTIGTLAHEFQHLINTGRRLYINDTGFEQVWMDEGLAHIAEELAFYNAAGRQPRQNLDVGAITGNATTLDAFNEFGIANFGRLEDYLRDPPASSPYGHDDDLSTRGAAWSLLRYLADRRGGVDQQFWFGLVNDADSGLANLQHNLGQDPLPLVRDWTVANYTDDAVPAAAQFTQPSWNFRSIYSHPTFGGYPLQVLTLVNGVAQTRSIKSGSAAYFKLGVAPAGTADLRVAQGGTTVTGACTAQTLAVGQVFQGTPSNASAVCLAGGATGAEYVAVITHMSAALDAFVQVSVSATGVIPPVGPPNPSVSPAPRGQVFPLDRLGLRAWDGGFHMRLRMRERRETAPLTKHGREATRDVAAAPADAAVRINIVRTK